jgi:tetratricopeptide (TPR) repeat protein
MCTTSLVLLSLLAQLATPSPDPQAKAQAQGLLTEGSALYEKGDYAGALEKFNAAYTAYPSPKLLFNIGQADRDLSRPVEALDAFEKFLAADTDAAPETTADARKSVAELQGKLGQIRIDCEKAGAEVSVDGKSVGLTPLSEPIWATPGHHQLTASHASAAVAIESVDVTVGSVQAVLLLLHPLAVPVAAKPLRPLKAAPNFDLETTSPAKPPASGARAGWWLGRKWTWVAAGGAALLGAGALTAGLAMQSKFDSLDRSCGSASVNHAGCNEGDIAAVRSREITANILWGVAGAAAVTAGVLFYVEGRPVSVSPLAGGPTGLIAAMRY